MLEISKFMPEANRQHPETIVQAATACDLVAIPWD